MGYPKEKVLSAYESPKTSLAASVAQWIEHRPVNRKVVGSIPCQGRPGPQLGMCERQLMDVSLPN